MKSYNFLITSRILIAVTLTVFTLSSCDRGTKSKTAKSSQNILELPLLKQLPADTLGFLAWNYDSPGFSDYVQTYQETFSNQKGSVIEQIQALATENPDLKPLADMTEWIFNEKFIETDLSKPQPLKNGVAFFELSDDGSALGAGAYFSSRDNFNLSTKLTALKKKLSEEGIETAPFKVNATELGEVTSYTISLKGKDTDEIKKLYVVANAHTAAITTAQELSEGAFQKAVSEDVAILKSPHFQKVKSQAHISGSEITLAFADVKEALTKIEKLLNVKNGDTKSFDPAQIPVNGVLFTGDMKDKSLWTSAYVTLKKDKGEIEPFTAPLKADAHYLPPTINEKSVLSLGFARNLLQIGKTALMMAPEVNSNPEVKEKLALVDQIDYLKLGVTQGDPGSLFPGIFLQLQSKDSSSLGQTLKGMLTQMIQSGQAPLTPWREKDISETKISYSLSPLGVGAYLASKDGNLYLTSSEASMGSLLTGTSKESLDSSFGDASEKTLREEKPLFVSHFNGAKMAELITMAQGNLAIFTGGKNPVDAEQIDQIKSMGNVLWTLAFQDDALIFHGIQRPTPKEASATS